MNITDLPLVNATLNTVAGVLLVAGRVAIKAGRKDQHRRLMTAALVVSTAFLSCYLYYHKHVGHVVYGGTGILRTVYVTILLTHIPLAMAILPASFAAVWFALKGNLTIHSRITRILWPVWMYVSVTGVLIYLMLYVF
jgi:putative membrane protein